MPGLLHPTSFRLSSLRKRQRVPLNVSFRRLLVPFLTKQALKGPRTYLPIGATFTNLPGHAPLTNPNLGLAEFQAELTT